MSIYFSPAACGFFTPAIHGADIPADAIAISAEDHAALLQGQASGSTIATDAQGHPVLVAPAGPTDDQLRAAARAERDRLLAASDYTQVPDSPFSAAERAAWRRYRQQLRDLPASLTDPAAIAWPATPSV